MIEGKKNVAKPDELMSIYRLEHEAIPHECISREDKNTGAMWEEMIVIRDVPDRGGLVRNDRDTRRSGSR